MKIKNILFSTLFIITFFQISYSQKSKVAAADKKFENNYYVDAIATYERIAQKGYKDEKMFQKLGNAYYFNAELQKAEKWYSELFKLNKEQEAEFYYRYSQSLKSVGNYDKSNEMMELFNRKSGNDKRAKLFSENKNYLDKIKANSGHYAIENTTINSENSDFGSALINNKLLFASARKVKGSNKVFSQTNESFTNLFESEIGPDGNLSEPKLFGGNEINTDYHESAAAFSTNGKTVYFTRNDYLNGKKGKISNNTMVLKLYKATLENEIWGNVTELPFNSNQYNVANPALSPDNKTLYFASDMPGTLGQSDLFKVTINDDGSYGKPENLGTKINTEGRESFPFVAFDNTLYFASDGHPGLGGFDVFSTKINPDGSYDEITNLGFPANSSQDDFGFSINNKGKGFLSSNRTGGKGGDDIYKVTELHCNQKIEGTITDIETKQLLSNVKTTLYNDKFELLKETLSDTNGNYSFEVDCNKKYYIRTELVDYITRESTVTTANTDGTSNLPIAIEKAGCKLEVGGDLAKCFGIKVIYFNLNKANITKEAAFELEKILDVMKQYPKLKLDVRSHTDSRQSAVYNQKLSDNRAKATINWLIKNGVNADRLSGKGYGESQLLNNCSDGVDCSEEEHQMNRRSEFIVVSIE